MDKAFFLSADADNVAYAYEVLWDAATTFAGAQGRDFGVVPLRTGGFALVSRDDAGATAWMLSASGELRPLQSHQLVRLVAHL